MEKTLKEINDRLKGEFGDLKLTRGIGSWSFTGSVARAWFNRKVRVKDLTDYSVEQWLEVARRAAINGTTE